MRREKGGDRGREEREMKKEEKQFLRQWRRHRAGREAAGSGRERSHRRELFIPPPAPRGLLRMNAASQIVILRQVVDRFICRYPLSSFLSFLFSWFWRLSFIFLFYTLTFRFSLFSFLVLPFLFSSFFLVSLAPLYFFYVFGFCF